MNENTNQLENRKGYIEMSMPFYTDLLSYHNGEGLRIIFSNFYPKIVDFLNHNGTSAEGLKFYGFSPLFRVVRGDEAPPTYSLQIHLNNSNETAIPFDVSFEEIIN